MKYLPLLLLLLFGKPSAKCQATVGTLLHEPESLQGYTFYSPFSGTKAFLVDNCGRLINEWARGTRPGLSAYFLENGLMLRTYKADVEGPFTSASNAGGLELVNWENETIWSYEFNTPQWLSHHDARYLPNGHILVLSWELVYEEELIELGRDPAEIAAEGYMWSERIVEVEPVGSNDISIVWEWHMKDHYVQEFDPDKSNYGLVADHPELLDINLPELNSSNSNSAWDWNHFNAIDYNQALDQILISVRNSDEVWIIDHSTNTEQAASHSGGNAGRGGDILYRWGNPAAYGRGAVSDQQLFGQHGSHWIPEGLPDAGKILIYNNGNGRPGPDYSTVEIISPTQDGAGGYFLPANVPFAPAVADVIYGDQSGEEFYSAYMSNAQRLPNGNTLVCAGSPGRIFEVTPGREVVWDYRVPLFGDTPATQGQSVSNNAIFRAYRMPEDFSGFDGLDLTAEATIELGDSPVDCELFVGVQEAPDLLPVELTYFAAERRLLLRNPEQRPLEIELVDLLGRSWGQDRSAASEYEMRIPARLRGLLHVRLIAANGSQTVYRFWVP